MWPEAQTQHTLGADVAESNDFDMQMLSNIKALRAWKEEHNVEKSGCEAQTPSTQLG